MSPPSDPAVPAVPSSMLDAVGWRVWLHEGWLMLPPGLRRVAGLKVADGGKRHRVYISTTPLDQPDEFLVAIALLNQALAAAGRPFITWDLVDLLQAIGAAASSPALREAISEEQALRLDHADWYTQLAHILPPRELP